MSLPQRIGITLGVALFYHLVHGSSVLAIQSDGWMNGRVFSDFYIPIRNPVNSLFQQISASVWLEGHPKLSEESSAQFVLTADRFENSALRSAESRVQLREGFISYAKSGWEIRMGQQIIPWGKSDVVNPTDFLSAKDYTFFNPDEETRRRGSPTLLLSWTPDQGSAPVTVTGVWIPFFAESKLLIPQNALPAGVTRLADPVHPLPSLKNSELAAKFSYNASNWDMSLSAFLGWNHFPELSLADLNPATVPPEVSIQQVFNPITAVGSDASFTYGKWTIRGEMAYVWTQNNDGTNPMIQPTRLDSVFGVERPLGDDFRIQVQALWRLYPRYLSPESLTSTDAIQTHVRREIASANALLLNYQDASRLGGTFRFSYSDDSDKTTFEVFLLGNFIGGDYLLRPKFTYAWTDSFRTTLGLDYYAGPTSRPLGSLKAYSALFLEGKYSF